MSTAMEPDAVLVVFDWPTVSVQAAALIQALRFHCLPGSEPCRSEDGATGCAYVLPEAAAWQPLAGARALRVPLRLRTELVGASAGQAPAYHYMVWTDVDDAAQDDFHAWYEQEHLPGLASVPGTILARRYDCLVPNDLPRRAPAGLVMRDAGQASPGGEDTCPAFAAGSYPRHLACYDLARRETFGSEPWLAVRATNWSSRVRPAFRNTRRVMYRVLTP